MLVKVCAIASCELDMSNSMQGYSWTQSSVFLEARNREKAQAHLFSSRPQLATPQRGAELERTRCVILITGNNYHLSFTIKVEIRSPLLLKTRELIEFIAERISARL